MQLWFMTGNQGKLLEAKHAFSPFGFNVEQFLIDGKVPEIIEPQCETLDDVADAKISQGLQLLKEIGKEKDALLVEDSGLFIESLGGFPGVYSAYVLDKIGCEGILKIMGDVNRKASFQASARFWDGNKVHKGNGFCPGNIVHSVRGEYGFGYDPIFVPLDFMDFSTDGLTFGEVKIDVKENFSHRKKALDEILLSFKNVIT
ncbi:MAG: non-canonical purine NTP pyrophosphatase [Euryarchaeota archaeon]|nr:non-canonical purine NTP pyrophosphatase [Euryarchaeota archaeon]|tara:strand:+ start:4783 stop:5388 length:606 start_codon:yes stop_codon:yes gene_type:complete